MSHYDNVHINTTIDRNNAFSISTIYVMNQKKQSSPLERLYAKKKKNVKASKRKADLLRTYADDNHKAIAMVIKHWLEQDEKSTR